MSVRRLAPKELQPASFAFREGTLEWAKQQIATHRLDAICPLLMSWVHPLAPEQQDKSLKRVPPGLTPQQHLETLTWQGAAWRYPGGVPDKVRARIITS